MHPEVINPKLAPQDRAHYFQAIHDHVSAFALDIGNLTSPAYSFGPPCHKPPIRLSPPHAKVMGEQLNELMAPALVDARPTS